MWFFHRSPKAPEPTTPPLAEMPEGGELIVLDDAEEAAAGRAWSQDRRDLSRLTAGSQSVLAEMGVDIHNLGLDSYNEKSAMVDGLTSVAEARLRCGDYHGAASSANKALAMSFILEQAKNEKGWKQSDAGLIQLELLARIHEEYGDYPRAIRYLDVQRKAVNKSRMPDIKEGWISLIDDRRSRLIADHRLKRVLESETIVDADDFVVAVQFAIPAHVKRYLDAGLDAEKANDQGYVPLHDAAEYGRISILELFLRSGCHVDTRDGFGRTALHVAAMEGQLETARFLLGEGADVTILDDQGKTPRDHAKEGDHSVIVDILSS